MQGDGTGPQVAAELHLRDPVHDSRQILFGRAAFEVDFDVDDDMALASMAGGGVDLGDPIEGRQAAFERTRYRFFHACS